MLKNLKWMQKFFRGEAFEEFVKNVSLFLIMNIKQLLIEKSAKFR
jgi:hypothetical protein